MFSVPELIRRKREGQSHTVEEMEFLIRGYLEGAIPDYQMAAWLMAVCFRGLSEEETQVLTDILVRSGEILDLSSVPGVKVDKHSTGGVGDKATLVAVPLAAACGVKVVKLAGRALGHTGGTLDKLEAIPGMRVELPVRDIVEQLRTLGVVIAGHTSELVPADKKLYALRDVTATADCLPLIAASIMSKKIAGGADAVVLDVKVGEGGFLEGLAEARELARVMVNLGRRAGRATVAVLSQMDQPLGCAVGNLLEVKEALETLGGGGPTDLRELSVTLASYMVYLGGRAGTLEEARSLVEQALLSGRGRRKFEELVAAQGGKLEALEEGFSTDHQVPVKASRGGYVRRVKARQVGEVVRRLGGGRLALDKAVDPRVGVVLHRKGGDRVRSGEELAVIHAPDPEVARAFVGELAAAWQIADRPPKPRPLVHEVVG